jgi:long-chain acyl-CoA synthetase
LALLSAPGGAAADTLPKLLAARAALHPEAVALREKEYGIWQRVTWRGYLDHVRRACMGFMALGLAPGDKVAILSENRREWLFAELGAMAAGAVGVGVYPTSPSNEVQYVLAHSGATIVVAEDQEQLDKILEVGDRLPDVRHIVVPETKGLRSYTDPRILSWKELEERGERLSGERPGRFEELVAATRPDDLAFLIYTSGTTGFPKGAMISHRNVLGQARSAALATGITGADSVVSYLPLCHVAEQIFSAYLPLQLGMTVSFAEGIRTIQEDLREIAPTVFLGVPRIWEKMQAGIQVKIQETGRLRRALFEGAMERGRKRAHRRLAGERAGAMERFSAFADHLLVLRALQNHVGLRRTRATFSAAAAISPEVLLFFHAMGIPVREGYGMTECTGFSFVQREGEVRLGTVGRPLDGLEFRLADDGELLKRGETIFLGYYRDEQATAEVLAGGWLQTGDVAVLDPDGHLRIVDRKKAIFVTSGGKNVSPSLVENTLKVSPYIKEAVVLGEGEKFVSALVQIDFENVGQWATERKLAYTNFRSLTLLPEVRALMDREVDRANQGLAPVEQVRKFRLLEKELDHDDNEVTATMKVRRKTIYEKFAPIIREIYQ